jgi:prepilin-type N-terminal cleavage/methylation domain-containing protein
MERRMSGEESQKGFTILEVIAVIIIIAVLLAVTVSRVISPQSISALTEADILKMHLRYAQLRALSDDVSWGISLNGSSYTLLRNGNTAPYNLPNESSPTHALPGGITVSGSTVTFDQWGSPGAANIQIVVSGGGGTINITKNTGFIP